MTGDEHKKLEAVLCTQCGGNLGKSSYYDDDEEENIPTARCLSCGTEYDQHTDLYYKLFADDLTADSEQTVFKLGIMGTLDGVEYEIIGRIRYQEEDEYEKSTWDEWLAVSSDGNYHYFVEEDGDVFSFSEYIPNEIDLESDPIKFDGKTISKDEAYIARIVLAQGELTWEPEIGEPVTCYDFKHNGDKYTIEQSEGEVSITKGDKISYAEIIEAFGLTQFRDAYNATVNRRSQYRNKSLVYLVAALVAFGLGVKSCVSVTQVPGVMKNKAVLVDNVPSVEQGKRVYTSKVLYGPFAIPKGNSLYDVTLRVDQRVQRFNLQWQSLRFMLIDRERFLKNVENPSDPSQLRKLFDDIDTRKEPLESYVITGDFWDEEGRDSDGYWHESDLTVAKDFVLDKKGEYYAYLELYSNRMRKIDSVKLKLEKTESARYYIIVMVLFIILMFINRGKAASYNELPFDMS